MWTIYLKELLELARDRKTFFFTIFVPVIAMPLIFAGFGLLTSTMQPDIDGRIQPLFRVAEPK